MKTAAVLALAIVAAPAFAHPIFEPSSLAPSLAQRDVKYAYLFFSP